MLKTLLQCPLYAQSWILLQQQLQEAMQNVKRIPLYKTDVQKVHMETSVLAMSLTLKSESMSSINSVDHI